jgi:glycosyltransferase involved in cell wall biosynthesis
VLLSIGRLFPYKGAEDFITVLENLHAAGIRNVKGILVGDGPLRPALEQQARERLPAGSVHFAGLVPPTDIPRWIAAADLVIHASLREGLARVIPQSLAGGVPVASYAIGGAAEVITTGVNGYICTAGDIDGLTAAVRSFVSDPEMKHALSNGAHATDLNNFSADTMVDRIEAEYHTITEAV